MGNQGSWCKDRPNENSDLIQQVRHQHTLPDQNQSPNSKRQVGSGHQSNQFPTSPQRQKSKSESQYTLTPEAQATYNNLKQQLNFDDYLRVQSQQQATNTQPNELNTGFKKLTQYDGYYSGQWNNSVPNGKGRCIFPDGSLLVGYFIKNFCQGKECYFIFKDGSYYKGNIFKNIITGKGIYFNENIQYQGNWQDGVPHGEGIQRFKDGDMYIGNFQYGQKNGTDCLFIWRNHKTYSQYKGGFKAGKISGCGMLTFKNGSTVQGYFDEDDITNATFTSNKFRYNGNIKGGLLYGTGKLQLLDTMDRYQGEFRDGQLYGHIHAVDQKQRVYSRYYFKTKQLRQVKGMKDKEINMILEKIQERYKQCQTHSEALEELMLQLDSYDLKFIEPFENVFKEEKYLILDVYSRVLFISPKALQNI